MFVFTGDVTSKVPPPAASSPEDPFGDPFSEDSFGDQCLDADRQSMHPGTEDVEMGNSAGDVEKGEAGNYASCTKSFSQVSAGFKSVFKVAYGFKHGNHSQREK